MPLLTSSQFAAQHPGKVYANYLRYVAKKGGPQMSAAAKAALAGSGASAPAPKVSTMTTTGGASKPAAAPSDPLIAAGYKPGTQDYREEQWAQAFRGGNTDAQVKLLNQQLGTSYGSMDEAIKALDLGYGFAGVDQWRANLAGAQGNIPDYLHNVSLGSAANDTSSRQRLLNYLMELSPADARRVIRERNALVPEWAPAAYETVTGQGVPWSLDLLASPEINLRDPTKPLFQSGATPNSLFGAFGNQAGELGFAQGLSAQQVMEQIYPTYWKSKNDPEFRAAASEAGKGLSFGYGVGNSLLMDTPAYQQYAAYGHPGDPTMRGQINGSTTGGGYSYTPLTGEGSLTPGGGAFGGKGGHLLSELMNGGIRPEYFADPQYYWDMLRSLGGAAGTAAFTGDPSYWFYGENAQYAPQLMDPNYLQRMLALLAGPQAATAQLDELEG